MRTLIVTITAALALAAPAGAATVRGVVVGKQGRQLAVATSTGRVIAAHGTARVGARVVVRAGTARAIGRADHARLRGVVVKRVSGGFVLSAAHTTILVHAARRLADTTPTTTPAPGTLVETEVEIEDDGDLDEQETDEIGEAEQVELEGVLAADVPAGASTLTIQLDHGGTVTVTIPGSIKLPALTKGTEVEVEATVAGTTFTATEVDAESDDQGEADDD